MNEKNREKVVNFFRELLNVYDFELATDINENGENIFRLNDRQNGNLGGIEQEEFYTLSDIIDRLEIYHKDYIYNSLENRKNKNEKIPKDDWDLTAKRYIENENIGEILNVIYVKDYNELINKNEKFELQDIIKILDEDENFYKGVCEKYINTMSKEMLLEKGSKILHIFIEDEYINLKEEGKININNYKEYLDENFEVYEYDFYQELFSSVVKTEIFYDLNDLELFDNNDEWTFYLSFEELKKLGYGFVVKDYYPLIDKYAIPEDRIFDFFDNFSLEQLNDFEKSLHLYLETDDITYDESNELYSKGNNAFNKNIICLVEGLITYEDFLEDYKEQPQTIYDLSTEKVIEYFKENQIKDLMDYGADNDDGLYKLTSMYEDIMNKLDIKYSNIYTEDVSDGKYTTAIIFEDNSSINIDTSAWNGIKIVSENIESIYEIYMKNQNEKEYKNEVEIEF